MISEDGIQGPYKVVAGPVFDTRPELHRHHNEDPTVWYSGGRYYIMYNHWPSKTCHLFSSEDGIHDWTYRGIAFKKGESKIFKYTDGTVNMWEFVERPTAYVENGHVTRITSYNVCYTKLLRPINIGQPGKRPTVGRLYKVGTTPM